MIDLHNKIIHADVLKGLKQLPDNSVDCILTSPPYWGLRDYGIEGQIGLEATLDEYIDNLLAVTAELKRVLKPTGTLWWNHGDCYGGNQGRGSGKGNEHKQRQPQHNENSKCLAFQNYRLVLRMIDEQGWICRNANIWTKPNSMPDPVLDRFNNTYEPVFMFAKTNKPQFYINTKTLLMQREKPLGIKGVEGVDWDWHDVRSIEDELALQEQCKVRGESRVTAGLDHRKGSRANNAALNNRNFMPRVGRAKRTLWRSVNYWFDLDAVRKKHISNALERSMNPRHKYGKAIDSFGNGEKAHQGMGANPSGKNPGDVWSIPTEPLPQAHFASFPLQLARLIITVGCPTYVCPKCGLPRVRISSTTTFARDNKDVPSTVSAVKVARGGDSIHTTLGWTHCSCNAGYEPGIVLDPFMGSGTVALVARNLLRDYIGIELNQEYIKIIDERLFADSIGHKSLEHNKIENQMEIFQ